ncbi:MAG: peptidoglycan-binding domain-containing protein [Chthoniobacterales bacterium]
MTVAAAGLLALAAPAHAQRRGNNGGGVPRGQGGTTMNHCGSRPGMNPGGGLVRGGGNFHDGDRNHDNHYWGGHYYGNHYRGGRYYGNGVNFYVGGFGYPYYYGSPFYYGYPYGYPYAPYYGYSAAYTYDPQGVYEGRVVNDRQRRTTRRVDPKDQSSVEVQVQQQLAQAGYYHGEIDGVIGDGSRRAIRSYERANGLRVDGRIDNELLSTMGLG